MDQGLSVKLQKAGQNRVVVSHAVGAADNGRVALLKVALFGGAAETYALPADLAYWLIETIGRAVAAGAIRGRRSDTASGSPEAQQIALYGKARPEIVSDDWNADQNLLAKDMRAHGFGNALGLQVSLTDGAEALLVVPDQVAILLRESLTLAATYLIDRTHPTLSRNEH
jgi:hypothetical protein